MADESYPPAFKSGRGRLTHRLNPWLSPEAEASSQTGKPSALATPAAAAAKEKLSTVNLGYDPETEDLITLHDTDRRAGLYVLGRSGTGKSTLLVNIIDQDLKHGHGVFFLDPHGDAIDTLYPPPLWTAASPPQRPSDP